MLALRFDPQADLILASTYISGPDGHDQVRLVFDTGATLTQIDRDRLFELGYSEKDKARNVDILGVTDPRHETYSVEVHEFSTLGTTLRRFEVAVVDFGNWKNDAIDGLLGWDFIRTLHYEQNGPKGLLTIY